MTSTVTKGSNFQRWVKKWIESNYPGSVVHNEVTCAKMYIDKYISKRNDILGCIDLIAIVPFKKPIFIQATMHAGVGKRLVDMVKVPWDLRYSSVQLWQDKGAGRKVVKELEFEVVDKKMVSKLTNKAEILRGKMTEEVFDE